MTAEVAIVLEAQFDWLLRPETAVDGQVGNLYEDELPDSPDAAVALYEYNGQAPRQMLGNKNPTENPRLQVMVRHPHVETAKSWSKQIMKFLITVNDQELSGTRYVKISAASNPSKLGVDSDNRSRYSANYEVEKEWSPDE